MGWEAAGGFLRAMLDPFAIGRDPNAMPGAAGAFATGQIADLAEKRAIEAAGSGLDQVKLRFVGPEDLSRGGLAEFLAEHIEAVRSATAI